MQKQFALTVSDASDVEEFVSASAARIASITHISLCEKSPSEMNTIIMISKNKNQLSSNISHLFDFLPQYAPRYAKVTCFFRTYSIYTLAMDNLIDYETEQTVIDYIPRNATLHSLAEFFSACSDATRAKIICALCISEMCVSDLSRILGINQTTCSHQLRLLRAADIVKQRRDGKIIYYSLKNKKIENVLLAGVDFLDL